jgi:hypothetical protein
MKMAWHWLKTNELPLGARIMKYNSQGKDVQELQELLAKTGFYYGPIDGYYGTLTEEAVFLVQRTFKLRKDGLAGPEVIKTLIKASNRAGRIIYTVKENENLEVISQKFGVGKGAWDSYPGQGNPRKRLYSGMRLLLREKAVYIWDNSPQAREVPVTGVLVSGGQIDASGKVSWSDGLNKNDLCVVNTTTEIWEQLFNSRKLSKELIKGLTANRTIRWGIDLSNAARSALPYWIDFLKALKRTMFNQPINFIIIPLNGHDQSYLRLVWANLPWFAKYCKLVLVADIVSREHDNLESFSRELITFNKILVQIAKEYPNILPVVSTQGWDWNLEQKTFRMVSNREAKLIRAINYQMASYSPESLLTTVNYTTHGEEHQLVYRDERGWSDFLNLIKRSDCLGLVIKQAGDLGSALGEYIADSFTIMPDSKI